MKRMWDKIEEEMNYCVYYHKNIINNKLYIGITNNLNKRWGSNGSNYKYCKAFYSAIIKYGWDNFEHIVLIDNIPKSLACIIETELIKKYKTQSKKYGYNIASGGLGGCTVKGNDHHLSKKVYQYDLSGVFIREWENAQRASEALGICVSDIHITCREYHKIKKAGNFMWRYEKYERLEPYVRECKNKAKILQIDTSFEIVKEYKNISYVDGSVYNKEKIINCCNKKAITHNRYYWSYEQDFDPISFASYIKDRSQKSYNYSSKEIAQKDLNGNIIRTYKSAREVEELTGLNRHTIQAYCKRGISNYGITTGYIWQYI